MRISPFSILDESELEELTDWLNSNDGTMPEHIMDTVLKMAFPKTAEARGQEAQHLSDPQFRVGQGVDSILIDDGLQHPHHRDNRP